MKILITGAAGQLARAMVEAYRDASDVRALSRAELDVTDTDAVNRLASAFKPDVIINCAAYNDVDRAQVNVMEALDTNAFAVRGLARTAAGVGAALVHYSTDFVFDGLASVPYTEEDLPNPQSMYAISKLAGEWFAREAPRAYVLRVESLFGGPRAESSVDRIIDAIAGGREARAFTDRTVSPSYVVDVVKATRTLLERGAPGLFHCVNTGHCTWFELAEKVAQRLEQPKSVVPISVHDVALAARRPQFLALSNAKLQSIGIVMPTWEDALDRHLRLRGATTTPLAN